MPHCPIPERGGTCLGALSAGTYSTSSFEPTITYTVPTDKWADWEDLPALFLLLPPGEELEGVDADTSDFIGIYRHVRPAAASCAEEPQPDVGGSAAAMATWFRSLPGLSVTNDRSVAVGGLKGMSLDLEMRVTWKGTCPYSINGAPIVPLIVGSGDAAGLHHVIGAGVTTRLYLLDASGGSIVIEVVDHPEHGQGLRDYGKLIDAISFAT